MAGAQKTLKPPLILDGLVAEVMHTVSIWERWDRMRPDGSISPGEMTSFNHYALGSIVDWLHQVLAVLVRLSPVGDLCL